VCFEVQHRRGNASSTKESIELVRVIR